MSGVVVTYRVKFGGGPRTKSGDAKNPATVATEAPKPAPALVPATPAPRAIPGLARRLALAYFVERKIEDGTLRDAANAAEVFGVTRPRMSQLLALLGLSAKIQERILEGELNVAERELRKIAAEVGWDAQA